MYPTRQPGGNTVSRIVKLKYKVHKFHLSHLHETYFKQSELNIIVNKFYDYKL